MQPNAHDIYLYNKVNVNTSYLQDYQRLLLDISEPFLEGAVLLKNVFGTSNRKPN